MKDKIIEIRDRAEIMLGEWNYPNEHYIEATAVIKVCNELLTAIKQSAKPIMHMRGHWWCAKCKRQIQPVEVTFEELHDGCGYPVVWVDSVQPQSEPKTAEKTLDIWLKWKPCINDIGLDASVLNAMEEHASQQPDLRRELIAFASWRDEHLSIPDTAELQVDEYLHSRTDADKPKHNEVI